MGPSDSFARQREPVGFEGEPSVASRQLRFPPPGWGSWAHSSGSPCIQGDARGFCNRRKLCKLMKTGPVDNDRTHPPPPPRMCLRTTILCRPRGPAKLGAVPDFSAVWASPRCVVLWSINSLGSRKHFSCVFWHLPSTPVVHCFWSIFDKFSCVRRVVWQFFVSCRFGELA